MPGVHEGRRPSIRSSEREGRMLSIFQPWGGAPDSYTARALEMHDHYQGVRRYTKGEIAVDRRSFLKMLAVSSSGLALGVRPGIVSAANAVDGTEFCAVLVDTTKCIGCMLCERACAELNELKERDLTDRSVLDIRRPTTVSQYTVVNRYNTQKGEVFVKMQCMHCNQASCVSACPVHALQKQHEGPVEWNTNCFGCRYCMVACPFDIPKIEYNSPTPRIQKCDFCFDTRIKKGGLPACVEACPVGALKFGTRRELLEEARQRIYAQPDKYYHHIYGEHEIGGTGWLYLSAVPFNQIGFRTDLGTRPYPQYTKNYLTNIAVVDLIAPPLLLGLSYIAGAKSKNTKDDQED